VADLNSGEVGLLMRGPVSLLRECWAEGAWLKFPNYA
jgi:hypothetical protein